MLKKSVAEFIGTFGLVFAGTGAIMINDITGGGVTHVGVGLTFGSIIAVMIFATGHISGAHINPAVTLGFAITKHLPWKQVPYYLGSQIAGAISASVVLLLLLGDVADLGATIPAGTDLQAFFIEIILTFFLMFVIMSVATDIRSVGQIAAIAIGATVGLEAIFAGPITGASMNPARSLGPAIVGWTWTSQWVYVLAPVIGAAAASMVYSWLRGEENYVGKDA
ncbi:MAG: aquaporin Z/aquaporin NIP [Chloroflexi bacterium]|jgi:MIP family channel proteins|nr:MAG: aquaporin Z/aquaporin NIP [Chloroflexota bacterium]